MTSEAGARELHRRDLVRRQSGLVTLRAHRFSGLVRRNGLRAAAFASRIMFLVLPLTCVYYPVSVLPDGLPAFAWALPPTSVFGGMRASLMPYTFRADLMIQALGLNAVWFAAATVAFLVPLASARRNGSLVQTGE
jgi:ABC-2 type transport system permease protein